MRRTWITIDVNALRNEIGLPPLPAPDAGNVRIPRPIAPVRRQVGRYGEPQIIGPGVGKALMCTVYSSQQEAEEGAQIQIAANPTLSLIIYEAIGVIESVPTTPVPKKWNENGEFILK